ncbi:hypothetical protein BB558_000387 [Smittium angustum]|uniref:Uncharacterized protein n=1 Tax=Smittium angustum TaxID=133377 RepID=A0A2U1JED1_SMIAN|nr:hypothetical protein BB558_000387 [Smittium angustum]
MDVKNNTNTIPEHNTLEKSSIINTDSKTSELKTGPDSGIPNSPLENKKNMFLSPPQTPSLNFKSASLANPKLILPIIEQLGNSWKQFLNTKDLQQKIQLVSNLEFSGEVNMDFDTMVYSVCWAWFIVSKNLLFSEKLNSINLGNLPLLLNFIETTQSI